MYKPSKFHDERDSRNCEESGQERDCRVQHRLLDESKKEAEAEAEAEAVAEAEAEAVKSVKIVLV
ncbi:hypothetical protein Ancab_005327 [Ancistrocladus abbreviatus]